MYGKVDKPQNINNKIRKNHQWTKKKKKVNVFFGL